jgi:hypothetical protein
MRNSSSPTPEEPGMWTRSNDQGRTQGDRLLCRLICPLQLVRQPCSTVWDGAKGSQGAVARTITAARKKRSLATRPDALYFRHRMYEPALIQVPAEGALDDYRGA